jgi:hypothetical protein
VLHGRRSGNGVLSDGSGHLGDGGRVLGDRSLVHAHGGNLRLGEVTIASDTAAHGERRKRQNNGAGELHFVGLVGIIVVVRERVISGPVKGRSNNNELELANLVLSFGLDVEDLLV